MVKYINNLYTEETMKFLWTTILVDNMDESVKFYEEVVGLKLTKRFQAGPVDKVASLSMLVNFLQGFVIFRFPE
jgi:predicted enzyme related to lactoylglutathione lyase